MSIRQPPDALASGHSSLPMESELISRGSSFTNPMSLTVSRHRMAISPGFIDDSSPFPPRDRLISIHLPRRLFRWLYSFSLFIFAFLTFGFVAVTPIDVIVQTLGTSYSGIKLFIVIIVCVVFLVVTLILYFLRIFHSRVALNDIPLKSVYIPFENDLPRVVCERIDEKLTECMDIKEKGGPLGNKEAVINHPGRSPPEYIQEKNRLLGDEGTFLPPNAEYEDVLRGFSDKLRLDGKTLGQKSIPDTYSFRELIVSLTKVIVTERPNLKVYLPDFKVLIELYEKMKFGKELINEKDLLDFMIQLDKLSFFFHGNLDTDTSNNARRLSRNRQYSTDGYDDLIQQSIYGKKIPSKSDFHYYNSDIFLTKSNLDDEEYAIYESDENRDANKEKLPPFQNLGLNHSESSVINPMRQGRESPKKTFELHSDDSSDEANSVWGQPSLQRYKLQNNSTGSVVRNKIAISKPQKSMESFQSRPTRESGERSRRRSSYSSVVYHEQRSRRSQESPRSRDPTEDEYEVRPYPSYVPAAHSEEEVNIGTRSPLPMGLADVDIRRLRSPEKPRRRS